MKMYFPRSDFAVGAPFHGTGSVSIWMGSEKGISPTPSQVSRSERTELHTAAACNTITKAYLPLHSVFPFSAPEIIGVKKKNDKHTTYMMMIMMYLNVCRIQINKHDSGTTV